MPILEVHKRNHIHIWQRSSEEEKITFYVDGLWRTINMMVAHHRELAQSRDSTFTKFM